MYMLLRCQRKSGGSIWLCWPPNHKGAAHIAVDCVWNVMAHVQEPEFVFQRNARVRLNRQGASLQLTAGSRGVRISGSNAGYTMFQGSVKGTGYPLHSPVSPSLPLPCVTMCHHISTGLYQWAGFCCTVLTACCVKLSLCRCTIPWWQLSIWS
jgi:hypothetical protein